MLTCLTDLTVSKNESSYQFKGEKDTQRDRKTERERLGYIQQDRERKRTEISINLQSLPSSNDDE